MLAQSAHPTLLDGTITYTAEDGTRRRIDVGRECADLWVAPDESAIAFITVDRSQGADDDDGPFVLASTLYIARRADHYTPVKLPVTTVRSRGLNWELLRYPVISPDGNQVVFTGGWANDTQHVFSYDVSAKRLEDMGSYTDYCMVPNGHQSGSLLLWARFHGEQPTFEISCYLRTPGEPRTTLDNNACRDFGVKQRFSGAACTVPVP